MSIVLGNSNFVCILTKPVNVTDLNEAINQEMAPINSEREILGRVMEELKKLLKTA